MKKVIVVLILLATTTAQAQKDFALGLSLVPSVGSGSALGMDAIKGHNNKWQLTLKLFYGYYKNETATPTNVSIEKSSVLGATIGTRYIIYDSKTIRPYLLGSLGFAYEDWQRSHTYTPYIEQNENWYIVYSARLGLEITIKQSPWSLDLNLGYLGLMGLDAGDQGLNRFMISVGVLRRFAANRND